MKAFIFDVQKQLVSCVCLMKEKPSDAQEMIHFSVSIIMKWQVHCMWIGFDSLINLKICLEITNWSAIWTKAGPSLLTHSAAMSSGETLDNDLLLLLLKLAQLYTNSAFLQNGSGGYTGFS